MAKMRPFNTKSRKLSTELVKEMYQRLVNGELTQGQAARIYGLGVIQVGRIARGESRAQETGAGENPVPSFNMQILPQEIENSKAELLRRFESKANESKGSWYDQPPPYEEPEMAPETLVKLDKALKNVALEPQIKDELDKLIKGD